MHVTTLPGEPVASVEKKFTLKNKQDPSLGYEVAVTHSVQCLVRTGDEVIVIAPMWPNIFQAIEVAGGGMMKRMRAAPAVIGREREHPNDATDPVIGRAAGKKGAVAAVMLDHEQAYQKPGGRNRDQQ